MPGQGTDVLQEVSDVERRLTELQAQIDRLSLSLHLWSEKQEQLPRLLAADSSSALGALERAETRLAALEDGVHRRLNELSDQMQSMVAEVRAFSRPGALPAPVADTTWPLEDVVRLHNQLRGAPEQPSSLPQRTTTVDAPAAKRDDPPAVPDASRLLPAAPAELVGRVERLERNVAEEQTQIRDSAIQSQQTSRRWASGVLALVILLAGAAGLIMNRLQTQLQGAEARVAEAETVAAETARTAAEQILAARQEVNREIAEANAAAIQAQTISDLLAAPDLVRYNLAAVNGGAARGQTTFSRSRGLVFTGSRLPPVPPGSIYQIWLLTPTSAHSAGTFVPDVAGRFTLATDQPPTAPAPIVSVSVTVEPAPGSERPTGPRVLMRPANE